MKKPRGFYRKTKVRGYTVTRDVRKLPKRDKEGRFKPKRKPKPKARARAQIKMF